MEDALPSCQKTFILLAILEAKDRRTVYNVYVCFYRQGGIELSLLLHPHSVLYPVLIKYSNFHIVNICCAFISRSSTHLRNR